VNITNWIQAISAGVAAIVTIVLARITYIYVRETKRMAASMETQTAIMAENYERNIAPICKPHFVSSATSKEETKIRFIILNYGKEIFYVIKIITRVWNIDNPQVVLQQHEQNENIIALPRSEFPDARIILPFNPEVSRYHPDREKKIKWESIFIVKDIKGREHFFPAGMRSLF